MNLLRGLGFAVVVMTIAMAVVAADAPAATLCEANEEPCLGAKTYEPFSTIEAKLKSKTEAKFSIGSFTASCKESSIKGITREESGLPLIADQESLSFAGCSTCSSAEALELPWEASVEAAGGGNGTITAKNMTVKLKNCTAFKLTCEVKAASITLDIVGGASAELIAKEEPLKLPETSVCAETGSFTATYVISKPAPLFVPKSEKPATLCKVTPEEVKGELVCPAGKGFSGKVEGKLEEGTEAEFISSEGTVFCNEMSMLGEFNEDGTSPKGGGITSLSFGSSGGECTSSYAGHPKAEIQFLGLAYDDSTLVYKQSGFAEGRANVAQPPRPLPRVRITLPGNPQLVCEYELTRSWTQTVDDLVTGIRTVTNGQNMTILLGQPPGCPRTQIIEVTQTITGAGGANMNLAR